MYSANIVHQMLLALLVVGSPVRCESDMRYYCSKAPDPVVIYDSDFLLDTTYGDSQYVKPDMDCNFEIKDPDATSGSLYVIHILHPADVSDEFSLTILDGSRTLMQDTPSYEKELMITRSNLLTVHFFTRSLSFLYSDGYQIRFTRFFGCPPGWMNLSDLCISPGKYPSDSNDFRFSQSACNSMRSNLLTLRLLASAGIHSVREMAEKIRFPSPVWIGLTDNTTAGPGKLYWLDGTPLHLESDDWVQCDTSILNPPSSTWSSRGCSRNEHTAYLWLTVKSFLTMAPASEFHDFVCAMPKGGTDIFFPIPSSESSANLALLSLLALIPFTILVVVLVRCLRRRQRQSGYQPVGADSEPPNFIFFRWITMRS